MKSRTWVGSVLLLLCAGLAACAPAPAPTSGAAPATVDESRVAQFADAVEAGKAVAVARVFALPTDGASAEMQDIVLGRLIEGHPRLFLQQLKLSQFADCAACLPGLLGNLGADYVDRLPAQLSVLQRRRDALAGVDDAGLASLRDRCIAVLDQQIKQLRGLVGRAG